MMGAILLLLVRSSASWRSQPLLLLLLLLPLVTDDCEVSTQTTSKTKTSTSTTTKLLQYSAHWGGLLAPSHTIHNKQHSHTHGHTYTLALAVVPLFTLFEVFSYQ
uniref:Putative secreted protein n=1 Tax=Anopheles triannulatus TaxID=58253 RepID=A0A2M4B0R8_9DIPT